MPGQKKTLNARTNWQVSKNDLAILIAEVESPAGAGKGLFGPRMYPVPIINDLFSLYRGKIAKKLEKKGIIKVFFFAK